MFQEGVNIKYSLYSFLGPAVARPLENNFIKSNLVNHYYSLFR